uniref:RNA-binding S4 domain-containing protein n=1 Tax=Ditylenchus dipsaci TaxID=166011 RepID=A0A915D9X8_9BILA
MSFSNVVEKTSCSSSRFRSYSSLKKTIASSEEDQDTDERRAFVDDGLPKDYKVRTLKTESRRLDAVLRKATNSSMSVTEAAILSGCVRINEKVKTKRGTVVEQDDEIDVWESAYEENHDLANVKQIYIHSWTLADDGYQIVVKYWKNLITDNWKQNDS